MRNTTKLHGAFRALDKSGNILTLGNYVDGNQQGLWSYFYFPSNDIREPLPATSLLAVKANYKDGNLHGTHEQFFEMDEACFEPNKPKCTIEDVRAVFELMTYKEGNLEGEVKKVDASGRVIMQGQY